MDVDSDLTAYYEAEARSARRAALDDLRKRLRRDFAALLGAEHRTSVVDVGAGPGLDVAEWQTDGFQVVGVDLAPANIEVMRRRRLTGVAASLYELPLRSAAFEALWTMSTFVHVPHSRFDEAIGELLRVVKPGAPLGIGTWGGLDFEGVPEFGDLRPYRFFSIASHERWRQMLGRHGDVEVFDTYRPKPDHDWEYQFAVLRASN